MTQTRLKRAARATMVVEKHTRTRDRITLMDVVEDSLARRASLAAEIAVIDAQLGKVYERLGKDIPVRVADPTPEGLALVDTPTPTTRPVRSMRPRGVTSPDTADLRARVREALAALQPVGLSALARHLDVKVEAVKYQLKGMRIAGEVTAAGATVTRVFSLTSTGTPAPRQTASAPVAAPSTRRTVVDDGVEFEPVWSGGKAAPSLLGDRAQRSGVHA